MVMSFFIFVYYIHIIIFKSLLSQCAGLKKHSAHSVRGEVGVLRTVALTQLLESNQVALGSVELNLDFGFESLVLRVGAGGGWVGHCSGLDI